MIIDKQEHKDALLNLVSSVQFPGSAIDFVFELKEAIKNAQVLDGCEQSKDSGESA